jgi:hypothetical protein
MIAALEFEYAPTADEVLDAMTASANWSAPILSLALLFAVPLIAYTVFVRKYPAEAWSFAALLGLLIAMAAVAAGVVAWRILSRARRRARQRSELLRRESFRVGISSERLEMRSPNIENVFRWSAFSGARETRKNVLLSLCIGGTIALPLRYLDVPTRRFVVAAASASTADTSRAPT